MKKIIIFLMVLLIFNFGLCGEDNVYNETYPDSSMIIRFAGIGEIPESLDLSLAQKRLMAERAALANSYSSIIKIFVDPTVVERNKKVIEKHSVGFINNVTIVEQKWLSEKKVRIVVKTTLSNIIKSLIEN